MKNWLQITAAAIMIVNIAIVWAVWGNSAFALSCIISAAAALLCAGALLGFMKGSGHWGDAIPRASLLLGMVTSFASGLVLWANR